MLDEAVKNEELDEILTGLYHVQLIDEDNQQYLAFDLETRQEISLNQDIIDQVYYSLVNTIGRLEPGFGENYKNLYRTWDKNPDKRIFQLNFLSWPSLSQTTEKYIKHRGIMH